MPFSNAAYAIIRRRNYNHTKMTICYLFACLIWACMFLIGGFLFFRIYQSKLAYLNNQTCNTACGNISYYTYNVSCGYHLCCNYQNKEQMLSFQQCLGGFTYLYYQNLYIIFFGYVIYEIILMLIILITRSGFKKNPINRNISQLSKRESNNQILKAKLIEDDQASITRKQMSNQAK